MTEAKQAGRNLDRYLLNENIEHQLTRPVALWYNGGVERSHRTNDKFFYSKLNFYDLDNLREQDKL